MKTPKQSWQRVTELFGKALEQPPHSRAEFLKAACADDVGLLHEVESLLSEHDAETEFLESPAVVIVAGQSALNQPLVGKQLGPYKIESQLGRGGMGEVFAARDKLGREVALKLLTQRFPGDQSGVARFQQEARTLLSLNHPHIVTVYDIDQIDGSYYIASELVEGGTLRERMDQGDLPLEEILQISVQVATALTAAHDQGIVHRDIKPENIMIRPDGFVKVLDFGIAKLTQNYSTAESEAPTLPQMQTAEGTVVGTAPYMSPEQARGLKVDERTDVWSLGVVVYEAVTGNKPFQGETTADVISAVINKTPAPLKRYAPDIPEGLEWIVSRALRKESKTRYQTSGELLADLKDLRTQVEIARVSGQGSAPPARHQVRDNDKRTMIARAASTNASSAEYLVNEIKRHRFAFLVGLVAIVASLAAIALFVKSRQRTIALDGTIQTLAVLPFKYEGGNSDAEYLSLGMTETLISSLSKLPQLAVKAPSTVRPYKDKEIDPQEVGRRLAVQAILTGRIVQHGDELTLYLSLVDSRNGNQLWGEHYDRKRSDLAVLQNDISRDVSAKLRRLTGPERSALAKGNTVNNEAFIAYLRGRAYWSMFPGPGFEKSREYFQQAIDLDPTYALGYTGLAHYYGFAAAVGVVPPDENWPKSEAALNKALELDDTLAESYNAMVGIQLYFRRNWKAAQQSFQRALELNPNSVETHHHYARCLVLFGRNDEAIAEMKRAVDLEPISIRYNLNYATLFFYTRQYDRAIAQLHQTLELNPNFGPAHEWLGNAYEKKGMQKEAVAEWATALRARKQDELASTLERTFATSGFAAAIRSVAQQSLQELLEKTKKGEYVAAAEYAFAYTRMGDKENALSWIDKAVDERNRYPLEFRVNPLYDSLRNEPRFQASLQRIEIIQ